MKKQVIEVDIRYNETDILDSTLEHVKVFFIYQLRVI